MAYRTLVAAVVAAACLSASPRAAAADDDPEIKGKKLSAWIADLKTGDPGKVMSATEAIGGAGAKAKAAVPALIDALKDTTGPAAYYASSALRKIGPDAVSALVEATKSKDPVLSNQATSILRREFPDDARKAGLGSIAEEMAAMKKLAATPDLKG